MSTEGERYTVQQGDSTTQLAYDRGLFWKTVWEHAENADLRKLRKKPNILKPGDEIFLPAKEPKQESGATEKRHRFRRKGVPEKLHIQFLDPDGKPYSGKPYTLTIDGQHRRGALDGDGRLNESIPPNARRGYIKVGDDGEFAACELRLGHLDPITEISGVQARLQNLGLYGGAIDGEDNAMLRAAVVQFRVLSGLEKNGGLDDSCRQKLEERYQS